MCKPVCVQALLTSMEDPGLFMSRCSQNEQTIHEHDSFSFWATSLRKFMPGGKAYNSIKLYARRRKAKDGYSFAGEKLTPFGQVPLGTPALSMLHQ